MTSRENSDCDEVCSFCHKPSLTKIYGIIDSRVLICGFCKSVKTTGLKEDIIHEECHLSGRGEPNFSYFGKFKA